MTISRRSLFQGLAAAAAVRGTAAKSVAGAPLATSSHEAFRVPVERPSAHFTDPARSQ